MSKPLVESDLKQLFNDKLGRILAIDPGLTTGFAIFDQQSPMEGFAWQAKLDHVEFVDELNEQWPNIIVCESFVHTHRTGVDYTPVEMIGLVKWHAQKRGILLVLQTPAYGKAFFSDDKLKKIHAYKAGMPHAMDALRHLHQFMMKQGLFNMELLK